MTSTSQSSKASTLIRSLATPKERTMFSVRKTAQIVKDKRGGMKSVYSVAVNVDGQALED